MSLCFGLLLHGKTGSDAQLLLGCSLKALLACVLANRRAECSAKCRNDNKMPEKFKKVWEAIVPKVFPRQGILLMS